MIRHRGYWFRIGPNLDLRLTAEDTIALKLGIETKELDLNHAAMLRTVLKVLLAEARKEAAVAG